MQSATFTASQFGTGETLTWQAYNAQGALIGSGTVSGSGNASSSSQFTIGPAQTGGELFDKLVFGAGSSSSYKLIVNAVTGQSDALDVRTSFTVVGQDADGDPTASSQSIAVTFDSGTTLSGTASADALAGGSAAETFSGGIDADLITGGGGNDTLSGGAGSDTFKWNLADKGTAGTPAVDTIGDFDVANPAAGGDRLDLRDLLQGEHGSAGDLGNLLNYLHFEATGGNTRIQISSSGDFAGGFNAGAVDQTIVLQGVDLTAGGLSDLQIIQDLINRGKLVTDGP
jgi:Ca2+-binding RTX toxin-like protein